MSNTSITQRVLLQTLSDGEYLQRVNENKEQKWRSEASLQMDDYATNQALRPTADSSYVMDCKVSLLLATSSILDN